MYTLSNEYLTATFDEQGRITYLENKTADNKNIIEKPADEIFTLNLKKDSNWENFSFGCPQQMQGIQTENSITFTTDRLLTRTGFFDISIKLVVTLEGENLVFNSQIINRDDCLVTDFEYPKIGVIKTLAGGKPSLLLPYQCGERINNIGQYLTDVSCNREIHHNSYGIAYPGGHNNSRVVGGSMQWLALTDKDQTLYMGCHDYDFYCSEFRADGSKTDKGAITLAFVKLPFVKPGETWDNHETVLKLYTGSWHKGADDYIEFAKTWRKPHQTPEWVKNMLGYFLVINKQQFGYEMWRYDQLPQLYELALKHGCDTLGLFGWYHSGHDNQYPELEVSESLGGKEKLCENIKKVQDSGGKVTLYQQGHLIDITTNYYKTEGYKYESRSKQDTPYYETYHKSHKSAFLGKFTNKVFSTSCPSCPEWRELMKEKTDYVASFGADGVLFDQIGGMSAYPCFNESHPHEKGKPSLSMSNGRLKLLDEIQTRSKEINPEYAFFTEHITDIYSTYVDCLHGLIVNPPREGAYKDIAEYSEKPEAINDPSLFRYCFPDTIITVRNPFPYINERMANYAFAFGLRFEMEIRYQDDCDDLLNGKFEKQAEYSKKVTDLRKKYWDIIGKGKYVDEVPISKSNPAIIAKAFEQGDYLAIALWNDTQRTEPTELLVSGYHFIEASMVDSVINSVPVQLLPQEIAVVLLKKDSVNNV